MPNEERDEISSNIDMLWLKAIYEDIRNLEEHIILAKTGFKEIEEFASLSVGDLTEIQLRNLKLSTIKFLNILDNVQTRISPKFLKATKKLLKLIENTISLEETNQIKPVHFQWGRNEQTHFRWKEPTDKFRKTINILDDKKSELIKELDSILYFTQEGSHLDKTKQKKKRR